MLSNLKFGEKNKIFIEIFKKTMIELEFFCSEDFNQVQSLLEEIKNGELFIKFVFLINYA